eukprot:474486-Rhodomonas_salina.3
MVLVATLTPATWPADDDDDDEPEEAGLDSHRQNRHQHPPAFVGILALVFNLNLVLILDLICSAPYATA